jgi:large subunit ribosomal protein L10
MALSKDKKKIVIEEVSALILNSKLTVAANYSGTTVANLQALRREARLNGTTIKVIKNRLFIKALKDNEKFKNLDLSALNGMILYAFNSEDEVGSAQDLAKFAKSNPNLKFVIGINDKAEIINAEDLNSLASLPSKNQLRAILVGTIKAPLSDFVRVLNANLSSFINVLNARKEQLN